MLFRSNVIVGRLIPAGTGMAFHKARKAKEEMDDLDRKAIALAEAEAAFAPMPEAEEATSGEAAAE